ncbi:hypothetical protein FRAHR75_1090001 [Frankia sp. Hr75.2]|nr:hypothetical protein FRAHR75_1090001 [Frankia sp. Hr75.2]
MVGKRSRNPPARHFPAIADPLRRAAATSASTLYSLTSATSPHPLCEAQLHCEEAGRASGRGDRRSEGGGEFGERGGQPQSRVGIDGELVEGV